MMTILVPKKSCFSSSSVFEYWNVARVSPNRIFVFRISKFLGSTNQRDNPLEEEEEDWHNSMIGGREVTRHDERLGDFVPAKRSCDTSKTRRRRG